MSLSTSARTSFDRDGVRVAVDGTVYRMDPSGPSHFEATDDPVRAYSNTLTSGKITGMGERYESCGDEHAHFCSQCGKPFRDDDDELVMIGKTCWRQECPRCGAGWAMRRSIPICAKMESLRKEITARRGNSPKFHHCTVKMDDFRSARDADDTFFQVVKSAIEEVGVNVFGGAIIHHPYTGDDEDDEDDDLGKWKERLFSGREWEGDVADELKEWHHAHVLVLADEIDHLCCESLYEKTGIFVHRIQDEDDDTDVSIYGLSELAEASTYALSHARLHDDADAYRYFGEVANYTADHRTEARCKQVVRSIVGKTLDLWVTQNMLCSREIDSSEVDQIPHNLRGDNDDDNNNDDNDNDDENVDDSDDDEQDDQEDSEQDPEADDDNPDCDDSDDARQSADIDWAASDAPESGESGVKCNGRLVPLEYAPSFVDDDDRDLAYEDELRECYRNWDPPENHNLTAFNGSD